MLHPVICNPVLNPLVDILNPVGWRAGSSWPASLALMWRDTSNAKPLRYITFNGKYLVVKNV
ncbi:MAG: hypothetical protein EOM03_12045 [Clostridia bacterium]|nr:hypothetical protein [Clostridia bacterium]